jgi:DNA-binding response OmpR family regulator
MDCTSATILLVEDHDLTRRFLADNLTADGFEILEACTGADGERLMATAFPDLAIVDLGLPDRDGLELLRAVRLSDRVASRIDPELPLVVLSGRNTELERLRGFEKGADDYLTKPFSYPELRARILALLRRGARRPAMARIRVGALEIDGASRQAWVRGEPLTLSSKEFSLLRTLASEPCRAFTREELLRGVWGYQTLGATRTLDSHASRLRRKLRDAGGQFVVNVWGVGYRLIDAPLE